MPKFTHAHARAVLAKAERQLKPDTARVKAHRPVGNGPSTDITLTMRDLFFARPSLTGAERSRADAILARPSDRSGDDLGGGDSVKWTAPAPNRHNNCQGSSAALALHVCVHWVTGSDRTTRTRPTSQQVSQTMEHVWDTETRTHGLPQPAPDDVSARHRRQPGHAHSTSTSRTSTSTGLYGYCVPTGRHPAPRSRPTASSTTTSSGYGTTPTNALDVTAAHEFFHAVQFGYDAGEDSWFMEGTATWMEDEVYDSINDNLQFLAYSPIRYPCAPADLTVDFHRYGSWIFFKYASETAAAAASCAGCGTSPTSSASTRYSLQAIRAAVSARTAWTPFFATFAAWNTRQPHGYSRGLAATRRRAGSGPRPCPGSTPRRAGSRINLPHLSSAPVKVVPTAKLKPGKHLRIDANAAADRARVRPARAAPLQERRGQQLPDAAQRRRVTATCASASTTSTSPTWR